MQIQRKQETQTGEKYINTFNDSEAQINKRGSNMKPLHPKRTGPLLSKLDSCCSAEAKIHLCQQDYCSSSQTRSQTHAHTQHKHTNIG